LYLPRSLEQMLLSIIGEIPLKEYSESWHLGISSPTGGQLKPGFGLSWDFTRH
jgi:hypothetical protein